MTAFSPLQQVLARGAAESDLPSLWAEGETALASPSLRLRVLETHQPERKPSWPDQWGGSIRALLGYWMKPLPRLIQLAESVQQRAKVYDALDDAAFAEAVTQASSACRIDQRSADGSVTESDLHGLAVVASAVVRVHGFSPHREQLTGALALLEGRMAEMATGEGKTLTASMAAVVAAWRGLPCHVVTANDYLAARDAELGMVLFSLCRVSAASVTGETPPDARGAAYQHDIVYTTAKDLLADHLRDGLAMGGTTYRTRFAMTAARQGGQAGMRGVVMRGVYQVIVDEADSVLIDEAVTPLIISSQHPDKMLEQAAREAVALARGLREGEDFKLERALRHIEWTDHGRLTLERLASEMPPFWRRHDRAEELVQMALYAMHLMAKDQHYVVEDDKVVLVDELTGRLARQRTLSLGMQQVLEASLDLPISPPSEVSARLSFQRFFRRFKQLGGMTGTAQEARGEFAKVYGLTTVVVPTHRPVIRETLALQVYATEDEKFDAIAQECETMIQAGRAVLIGVRSVRSSMALGRCIKAYFPRVDIEILHALNHEREGAIVAAAGRPGAITIATNMAGRGTDISLAPSVRERGGLHVIIAEVNDYARIDRQLLGRCARQGDPGSVRYFLSFDDELFRRFLPAFVGRLWHHLDRRWPNRRMQLAKRMIRFAQWRAERLAFRQRQSLLEHDTETEREGF